VITVAPASDDEPEFPHGEFEELDQFYATLACHFWAGR
jgi:hypothetical protein